MTPAGTTVERRLRLVSLRTWTVARVAACYAASLIVVFATVICLVLLVATRSGVLANAGDLITKLTGARLHLTSATAIGVYVGVAALFVLGVTLAVSALAVVVNVLTRLFDGVQVVVVCDGGDGVSAKNAEDRVT